MSRDERSRATAGLVLFVVLSFLGSWSVAATLRVFGLSVEPGPLGTRLLTTSLLYAVSMGWQPLVATWIVRAWVDSPHGVDLGLRTTRPVFNVVGGVGALVFVASAAALATLSAGAGWSDVAPLRGRAEPELATLTPSASALFGLTAAFGAALALIWVQALSEEIGWRGYFLPRAMERFGRWPGLFAHGAVWGLWYAPVLFFASYGALDGGASIERCAGFIFTCLLLGTLFGWLRLAAGSLAPVVLANTTLTLAAGLPYLVHGVDAGPRSASFGPPGWFLLVLVICALFVSRWRHVVNIPERLAGLASPPSLVLARSGRVGSSPERARLDRTVD